MPIRTCIACRKKGEKTDFLRVVRMPSGEIEIDPSGKTEGRGASICPTKTCFERAFNRKGSDALSMTLKTTISLEAKEQIRQYIEQISA